MANLITKKRYPYFFDPSACEKCQGKCCSGQKGLIKITTEEIKKISKFIDLNSFDFIQNYTIKIENRISIKEVYSNGNFNCIFFDTERKKCKIYSVRPEQCRTFPFWPFYKNNVEDLKKECPGIFLK